MISDVLIRVVVRVEGVPIVPDCNEPFIFRFDETTLLRRLCLATGFLAGFLNRSGHHTGVVSVNVDNLSDEKRQVVQQVFLQMYEALWPRIAKNTDLADTTVPYQITLTVNPSKETA